LITHIEELSLNAWAALQTMVYDGWIIRFAEGYTKRANSVNPLYTSSIPIEEKLHYCENLYRSRNLPVVCKICPLFTQANWMKNYLPVVIKKSL